MHRFNHPRRFVAEGFRPQIHSFVWFVPLTQNKRTVRSGPLMSELGSISAGFQSPVRHPLDSKKLFVRNITIFSQFQKKWELITVGPPFQKNKHTSHKKKKPTHTHTHTHTHQKTSRALSSGRNFMTGFSCRLRFVRDFNSPCFVLFCFVLFGIAHGVFVCARTHVCVCMCVYRHVGCD